MRRPLGLRGQLLCHIAKPVVAPLPPSFGAPRSIELPAPDCICSANFLAMSETAKTRVIRADGGQVMSRILRERRGGSDFSGGIPIDGGGFGF